MRFAITYIRAGMLGFGLAATSFAGSGSATTLTQTLVTAYANSPVLDAARAELRQTDEGVAQARAIRRPTVSATANAGATGSTNDDFNLSETVSGGLEGSVLVYDFGQSPARIESAVAGVASSRELLRNTEQDVLLDAVTAFMDVRRDIEFVAVARNNVDVLDQQVQASQDRFDLGEVTRTDVSLSEARAAAAQANLAAALGNLELSEQQFRAVVGVEPVNLETPPALPSLPSSAEEAEAIAVQEHPRLLAARFAQTAAEFNLRVARAARGPSIRLTGDMTLSDTPNSFDGGRTSSFGASAGVNASVPLYQGGQLSSVVREAEAALAESQFDVQNTARQIRQAAASSFAQLRVARASILANQEEVRAAQIAFDGVQEEATLGARTTLDVLDLEQDLRDAQVELASSQRDEYVAAFELLSAMGLLSVSYLGLPVQQYNPDVNYNRVQNAPYSTIEGTILDKLRDRYSR